MAVEETARSVVISAFQSKDRRPLDEHGLGLVLSRWLGITRASVIVRCVGGRAGEFEIHCHTPADAKVVVDWFGGTRTKNVVRGHVVDLTL